MIFFSVLFSPFVLTAQYASIQRSNIRFLLLSLCAHLCAQSMCSKIKYQIRKLILIKYCIWIWASIIILWTHTTWCPFDIMINQTWKCLSKDIRYRVIIFFTLIRRSSGIISLIEPEFEILFFMEKVIFVFLVIIIRNTFMIRFHLVFMMVIAATIVIRNTFMICFSLVFMMAVVAAIVFNINMAMLFIVRINTF